MRFKHLDQSLSTRGMLLVSVPMIAASIFLIVLGYMLYEAHEEGRREARTKEILVTVQNIGGIATETASIMYKCVIRKGSRPPAIARVRKDAEKHMDRLEKLIAEDPALRGTEEHWLNTVRRELKLCAIIDDSIKRRPPLGLLEDVENYNWLQLHYIHELDERHDFSRLLERRKKESENKLSAWNDSITAMIFVALLLNGIISLILSAYLSRSINRRIARVVDNSNRLSAGQELHTADRSLDEIGRLDRVLHRVANSLRETQQHQRAIVENAVDVIASLDENCRFKTVNPAVIKSWGYMPEELIGHALFEFIHEDDIADLRASFDYLRVSEEDVFFEARLSKKDGSVRNLLLSVKWLETEKSFSCVAHDMTQRKLAQALISEREQTIRFLLESAPFGLAVTGADGTIEMTNARLKKMFGYHDSELLGKKVDALMDNSEFLLDLVFQSAGNNTGNGGMSELAVMTKSGDKFAAEVFCRRVAIAGNEKVLVTVYDVSKRHELERLKREYVAMVSHDLRTPLSTILLSMQVLNEGGFGELNDEGRAQVDIAEQEVDRLISMVNSLLDIEKFEAGQMQLEMETVNLESVVSHSVQALSNLAERKGINLVYDVADAATLEVLADRTSLVQVFVNLIGNAIKFSPDNSSISIAAAAEGKFLKATVCDQGRGIPSENMSSIFERFEQVQTSDRTEKKGSGLGLSICKLIVEAHGGTIGVESRVGRGSTFWFQIPIGSV